MSNETNNPQQPVLLATPQTTYIWKAVQEVKRGDVIVIANEEVKVLGIRSDTMDIFLAYTDPQSGKKVEQLYRPHDFVYCKA